MRQMPEVASSTHKWRKGAPVAGLMAVPFRMMPPRGAVTAAAVLFCGFGTPRYCIVVVAGVTLVWAFAVTMASIRIVTRQNKLRAESVGTQFLPWAAVIRVEELIFFAFLSRSLAPGSSLLFMCKVSSVRNIKTAASAS